MKYFITITRRIMFHAGHMLKEEWLDEEKTIPNPCHGRHGHEYILECTVKGDVQEAGVESGMVMNFGRLKGIMMEEIHDRLDHKFIIQQDDPRKEGMKKEGEEDLFIIPWTPTAERLVWYFAGLIRDQLPVGYSIYEVRLQETSNCWAIYHG